MPTRIDDINRIMANIVQTDINTIYLKERQIIHKENHEKAICDKVDFLTKEISLSAAKLVNLSLDSNK
ncbi:MAG: hypothetical protein SFW35_04830 [Chitinophagales bacterium]|nr:hypothetical protein [Chitinophagales bacterium]